ncbi:MAG: tripartite tricarboxylate transporter substrate binding protein [Proteobacteria bacterium]|nr:tripartite tricarboxylate transporter substrate binding protein [Pseudomonadota bacterium]MCH9758937.1 tripartite tricarboxylate transporter substrate binding protein [Pseudomonadota bacterium]
MKITKTLTKTLSFVLLGALTASPAWSFEASNNAECIAPANPGGGWDFTCRQAAKTLAELNLIPGSMTTVNKAGGGGGVAFAEVVGSKNDENSLIVAASAATATRLAQGAYPGNNMGQVRWVGTIGADYGMIAVGKDSPYKSLTDLLNAVKADPSAIAFAGGSAVGGWDHLKVLLATNKMGISDPRKVKYIGFDGGGDAVTQILAGNVQAFTGDASEVLGFLESGDLVPLAVLSEQRLGGQLANVPTAKEQGIDVIGANWRGFYAPGGMSDEAYQYWVKNIKTMYASDEWKAVMKQNGLAPLELFGDDFNGFVANSVSDITDLSKAIGIIQ